MLSQLLQRFGHYAFNHTAHIFVSLLDECELGQLLLAVQGEEIYGQLAHLVRARMVLLRLHRIDRTLYFVHFEAVPREEFENERCNLLAKHCHVSSLEGMVREIERVERKGEEIFGEEYGSVREAITQPDLPLPPIKRETIAPHCQTVYQVVLACEKLNCNPLSSQELTANPDETTAYFFDLLNLHIRMVQAYLDAIIDPLQRFAEITYRLMIYRNTVLALHALSPFPRLSKTMQLWNNALSRHYETCNAIFLELAGFRRVEMEGECGLFPKELLIEQGYLNDYAEGLIDLSVDEDSVAYCGHSRQSFGALYSRLEGMILSAIGEWREEGRSVSEEEIEEKAGEWMGIGLKPSTIRKILRQLGPGLRGETNYCRRDSFIETCARINGLPEPCSYSVVCN